MTRFEKFQSMTIEEIAAELCSLLWCVACPVYENCNQRMGEQNDDVNGVNSFLEWLKEEGET